MQYSTDDYSNSEKEFGPGYKGKISLELKGQVYVPFIELTGFDYKIMKRGKEYSVTWSGGRGNNVLNLELYRNEERMHVFPNVANVGEYTMVLPKKIKPGNYILKVSDTKNQDDIVYTKQFKINGKLRFS